METPTQAATLRQMRNEKGLTVDEVAPLIAAKLGRESYDPSSVTKAETIGVFDGRVLMAYASVYKKPLSDIFAAVGIPVEEKELFS